MTFIELLHAIAPYCAPIGVLIGAFATIHGITTRNAQKRYEKKLEHKNYVSKVRFDAEFQIYRELSSVFFDLDKAINTLIPIFEYHMQDENAQEKIEKKNFISASQSIVSAQDTLHKNAPFIPQQYFELYDELIQLSRQQTFVIREKRNPNNYDGNKGKPEGEDYLRSIEINKKLLALNGIIRDHLTSLDVDEV
jgi:hypothetical protein